MTAIHQHHAYAQFPERVAVKRVQPLAAMEADQEGMEVEVVADGARPVLSFDRFFILFHRLPKFFQQIGVGTMGGKHGWQLQHPPELVYLMDIAQGELRDSDASVKIAPEQALDGEDSDSLAHGVARDA